MITALNKKRNNNALAFVVIFSKLARFRLFSKLFTSTADYSNSFSYVLTII